jgi:hypothetical protein
MTKLPRVYTNYAYEEDRCIVRTVASRHAVGFAPVPDALATLADQLIGDQVTFPIDAVRNMHAGDITGQDVVPSDWQKMRYANYSDRTGTIVSFDDPALSR